MEQVRKVRSDNTKAEDSEPISAKKSPDQVEEHKRLAAELLDEIDAILEENAKDFVEQYIQKGGE